MSDANNLARNLRERLGGNTEDRLGRALSELLDSPLLTGAIGRAFDAREKATQAQEVALGALNIPSAADIERLTRRLRSVSQRLEGIEDGVDRLDRGLPARGLEARLTAIEEQLRALTDKLERSTGEEQPPKAGTRAARSGPGSTRKRAAKPAAGRTPAKAAAKASPAKGRKAV